MEPDTLATFNRWLAAPANFVNAAHSSGKRCPPPTPSECRRFYRIFAIGASRCLGGLYGIHFQVEVPLSLRDSAQLQQCISFAKHKPRCRGSLHLQRAEESVEDNKLSSDVGLLGSWEKVEVELGVDSTTFVTNDESYVLR